LLDLQYTNKFKKEFKKLQKNVLDFDDLHLFFGVIHNLKNKIPLAQHFEDHPLKGEKQSRRDCHIRPDLVLIYKLDDVNNKLILERIGSHSELFR
jgi:mRNA interferase YafQ